MKIGKTKVGRWLVHVRPVHNYQLLILGSLIGWGLFWVVDTISSNSDADRFRDRKAAAQIDYTEALRTYERDRRDFAACESLAETRVETRLNFRSSQLDDVTSLASLIIQFFPESTTAEDFAEALVTEKVSRLDNDFPLLSDAVEKARCTPLGPEPVKPPILG
jgi:hypothetical protein